MVPILNKKKQPIDYFSNGEKNNLKVKKEIQPLMIMAGGLGTRMQPFTSNSSKAINSYKWKASNYSYNEFV